MSDGLVEVEVLKPHGNPYGDTYQKEKGGTYSLPEVQAAALEAAKLVKRAKPAADAPAA